MKKFFTELINSFKPDSYSAISKFPSSRAVKYFTKVLILALVIMCLLFIPKIANIPAQVSEEASKVEEINLDKCLKTGSVINIPDEDPFLVIDPTDQPKLIGEEKLLLTKESFSHNLFKDPKTISLKDKAGVGKFLAIVALFTLPSIVIITFILFWIKYLIILLLISIVYFLLLDLTHFRLRWKQVFNAVCFASTIPILIEVISIAFNSDSLIPLLEFAGIKVYLIGLIIFLVTSAIAVGYVNLRKEIETPKF